MTHLTIMTTTESEHTMKLIDPLKRPERPGDESILAGLRDFHEATGQTSSTMYDAWARENGFYNSHTVMVRFDGWTTALEKAGIKHRGVYRSERRYTREDLWAAGLQAMRNGASSRSQIRAYLGDIEGAPSLSLLVQRLGSWSTIIQPTLAAIIKGISDQDPDWVAEVSRPRDWSEFQSKQVNRNWKQNLRKAMKALGPRLTTEEYNRWAEKNNALKSEAMKVRSGLSWADMLTQVGAMPGAVRRDYQDATGWHKHLADAMKALGEDISYGQYQEWARKHSRPSNTTLGRWAGKKWTEMVDEVKNAA